MEETNQKDHLNTCTACKNCGRGCSCYGMCRRHTLIRILFALIVLFFAFAGGMRLGEMKARFGEGYGHHEMMQGEEGYYLTYPTTVQPAPAVTPSTPAPATAH